MNIWVKSTLISLLLKIFWKLQDTYNISIRELLIFRKSVTKERRVRCSGSSEYMTHPQDPRMLCA